MDKVLCLGKDGLADSHCAMYIFSNPHITDATCDVLYHAGYIEHKVRTRVTNFAKSTLSTKRNTKSTCTLNKVPHTHMHVKIVRKVTNTIPRIQLQHTVVYAPWCWVLVLPPRPLSSQYPMRFPRSYTKTSSMGDGLCE